MYRIEPLPPLPPTRYRTSGPETTYGAIDSERGLIVRYVGAYRTPGRYAWLLQCGEALVPFDLTESVESEAGIRIVVLALAAFGASDEALRRIGVAEHRFSSDDEAHDWALLAVEGVLVAKSSRARGGDLPHRIEALGREWTIEDFGEYERPKDHTVPEDEASAPQPASSMETTNGATPGSDPSLPWADAIGPAIRAIVDARASGKQATWDGVGLLEQAYGNKAFRHGASIFRDNEAMHSANPPPRPSMPDEKPRTGLAAAINASAMSNAQIERLKLARVDPEDGTVSSGTGEPVEPVIETAARAIAKDVLGRMSAAVTGATWRYRPLTMGAVLPKRGPLHPHFEFLPAVFRISDCLLQEDSASAANAASRYALRFGGGWLGACRALAVTGFVLGVTPIGAAALGLAATNGVIGCNCFRCMPPDHAQRPGR